MLRQSDAMLPRNASGRSEMRVYPISTRMPEAAAHEPTKTANNQANTHGSDGIKARQPDNSMQRDILKESVSRECRHEMAATKAAPADGNSVPSTTQPNASLAEITSNLQTIASAVSAKHGRG